MYAYVQYVCVRVEAHTWYSLKQRQEPPVAVCLPPVIRPLRERYITPYKVSSDSVSQSSRYLSLTCATVLHRTMYAVCAPHKIDIPRVSKRPTRASNTMRTMQI